MCRSYQGSNLRYLFRGHTNRVRLSIYSYQLQAWYILLKLTLVCVLNRGIRVLLVGDPHAELEQPLKGFPSRNSSGVLFIERKLNRVDLGLVMDITEVKRGLHLDEHVLIELFVDEGVVCGKRGEH